MMNKSKKVKMLSKCYTFLAFATCTILCTSSKDAKAMFTTGKLGSRISMLAKNFGGPVSDTINYGIIGGSTSGAGLSGAKGGIGTISAKIGGTGTGGRDRGYSSAYHTGTGGGGFTSSLSGIRLATNTLESKGRNVSRVYSSVKIGSDGLINLSVSSGGIGGLGVRTRHSTGIGGIGSGVSTDKNYSRDYYTGTGSSGNTQKALVKIKIIRTRGDGIKEVVFGNELITSSTGGNGGKNLTHSMNFKGRVIRN